MAQVDSEVLAIVEGSTLPDLTWPKGKARAQLSAITGATGKLGDICLDGSLAGDVRFKACEAYFTLGGEAAEANKSAIAEVYAGALEAARTHNAWGLPESIKSSSTSRNLIGLGRAALPALKPLLSAAGKLVYEGSEEPTISEMRDYRIYDLAGAIAAEIAGRSYPADTDDPAVREKAARELSAELDP